MTGTESSTSLKLSVKNVCETCNGSWSAYEVNFSRDLEVAWLWKPRFFRKPLFDLLFTSVF